MKDKRESLEALVRQTIASVSWSHKIQRKQGDIYGSWYGSLNLINIIASALTSVLRSKLPTYKSTTTAFSNRDARITTAREKDSLAQPCGAFT